jgi:hypothetical protein
VRTERIASFYRSTSRRWINRGIHWAHRFGAARASIARAISSLKPGGHAVPIHGFPHPSYGTVERYFCGKTGPRYRFLARMKLTHVEIENFRCFEHAVFDLAHPGDGTPLGVVLLVGDNGSGKSSFLQAVSGFFTMLIPSYGADPPGDSDVRRDASHSKFVIRWSRLRQLGVDLPWALGARRVARDKVLAAERQIAGVDAATLAVQSDSRRCWCQG